MMSEEQRARYLPRMAKGEFLGAFSMSEPNAGSDISNISCRARKDGASYLISGNKYWCTFADGADFLIIIARTSDAAAGQAPSWASPCSSSRRSAASCRRAAAARRFPRSAISAGRPTSSPSTTSASRPQDMIGEEGHAFYYATSGLETARAHTAARAIGLGPGRARRFDRRTPTSAGSSSQPISDFQAIRFKIAEMATEIEAARQLNYFVCEQIDTGQRCDKEASMVKLFASEMAERVCSEGIQIHGGAGYTTLHAVERHWRDARLTKIFEGTSEIQKRIISDRLLGRGRN